MQPCYGGREWPLCVIQETVPATSSALHRFRFSWSWLLKVGLPLGSRGRRAGASSPALPHLRVAESPGLSLPE